MYYNKILQVINRARVMMATYGCVVLVTVPYPIATCLTSKGKLDEMLMNYPL